MQKPSLPDNEAERLAALRTLQLLDTEPEERFDRLTRMAKRIFQVPIALLTLVDDDRQWFKSCFGINDRQTSRDISFCGHAILGRGTFVIENTLADVRFADNPMVTDDPKIRFYAGTPIRTESGFPIGTLCIIDQVARVFHPEDVEMLEDLARLMEKEIHAVQLATLDDLTRISNRRGFYMLAEHSLSLAYRNKDPAVLAVIDLNQFKPINDQYGHAEGDLALRNFAGFMQDFFRESDLIGRLGGDEFSILMLNTSLADADIVLRRFRKATDRYNNNSNKPYRVDFSVGVVLFDPGHPKTIHQLVELADEQMYNQKNAREP